MNEKNPTLCIVAGPNGSGKTSTTVQLLHNEWAENSLYINPDNIAQEQYGDWNSPVAVLKAAELATKMRYECLRKRQDFVFETVFSSDEKLAFVEEAKKAGLCDLVISTDESLEGQDKVLVVSDSVMEKLSYTKTPQPIMAVCHKKDNILKHYDRVLILDGVQDPGNLGTILRSALAFGFKQIVMSPDCVDLYNDKALRSTQGAVFHLDIVRDELSHVIPELQKLGVRVIATSLHNASSIDDIKSTDKMAFVMGNEGNGVRDETIAMSDASLYIPIDTMESLNVGVAAGIVMYTFKTNY